MSRHAVPSIFSRSRAWILTVLVLVLLLAAAGLYLQSRHGFRHVIVPAVRLWLPGTLEVRDGYLRLPGTLEVEGLRYVDRAAGLDVEAERLFTAASVLSFLGDRLPVVYELELQRGRIAVSVDGAEDEGAESEPGGPVDVAGAVASVPLVVQRGHVDDLRLSLSTPQEVLAADDLALTVEGPGPGEPGHFGVTGAWRVLRKDTGDVWSGTADLALELEQQPGPGSRNDSETGALSWSGSHRLVVRQAPGVAADAQPVRVTQSLEGRYDRATRALTLISTAHAHRNDVSIAEARLEVEAGADVAVDGARPVMTVSLDLHRVAAAAMNLALGSASGARFETGRLKGRLDLAALDDRVTLRSSITGEELRLRLDGTPGPTPPVAASALQDATFDRQTEALTLQELELSVSDETRSLVTVHLNRPLRLTFGSRNADEARDDAAGQPAELSVTVNRITMEELRPWLALTGSGGPPGLREGVLQAGLLVTVRDRAESVEVDGQVEASRLVIQGAGPRDQVGPLRMTQEVRATLERLEILHVRAMDTTITMDTGKGPQSVGRLHASGSARVQPGLEIRALTARLGLAGLPGVSLNPLLAQPDGARLAGASLSGTGELEIKGRQVAWETDLRGGQVRVHLAGSAEPTPPLDLTIVQAGRYDRDAGMLTLERLTLEVLEGRRAVVAGVLDQPLTVALAPSAPEAGGPPSRADRPIHMTLTVDRLGVAQLRPWLALAGSGALEPVQTGALDGRVQVEVRGRGDSVTVAGHLDAADVRLRDPAVPVPLALRTRVDATIDRLTRVTLKTALARLLAGPKELAQMQLVGAAEPGLGRFELTASALSANVVGALERLGWVTERQRELVAGGELDAELRLAADGAARPMTIAGDVRVRGLRATLAADKALTKTVAARLALEVNAPRTEVRVQRLALTVQGEGPPAELAVTGRWPLPASERPGASRPGGQLVLAGTDVDVAPFVDVLDLLPGRAPGPVLLSVEATISRDPETGRVQLRGRETVGPVRVRALGQTEGGRPTTIHVEHDIGHGDEEVRVAALRLTSERATGLDDRVSGTGRLRLGPYPRLEWHGAVDALDAGWYADLLQAPGGEAPPARADGADVDGTSAARQQPAAGRTPLVFPLDLDVETTIGTVQYRTLAVKQGRLVATGTGDRAEAMLEPTGFAGGTVQATVTAEAPPGIRRLTWFAEGKGLDLEAILRATEPTREPPVTGKMAFTTSGRGQGPPEALAQNLSGTAVLDVTDGRFVKSDLLAFIAKHTGIQRFESFGFQRAHADLRLEDGSVHLTSVEVRGPGLALGASGRIGLDGQVDASVVPKVSGDLAQHARRLCVAPLLTTVGDLTVFPIAVTVKGTIEQPRYGIKLTAADALRKGVGGLPANVLETLKECANLPKVGRQLAEGALDIMKGAAGILEGLFTKPRKQEENEK